MNTDKTKLADDNESISPQLTEALAIYLENLNGGSETLDPAVLFKNEPHLIAEWQQLVTLLRVPQSAKQQPLSAGSAWQKFRSRAFDVVAVAPESLGSYIAVNEQAALAESGLSPATLEKMKNDPTLLKDLKHYELKDFVDVARRNGVNDTTFPRMLKWLKGLGKSLFAPPSNTRLRFAREEDYKQGLSESEIVEKLNEQDKENDDL